MTTRFRWLFRFGAACLALLAAVAEGCVGEDPPAVEGAGGNGPIQYATGDERVAAFWHADSRSHSDYVGAGGDSVQPELQPRPELHADRVVVLGSRVASLAVHWPARSAELRLAQASAPEVELAHLDLRAFAGEGELAGDEGVFFRRFDRAELFALEGRVVLVLPSDEITTVVSFDASADELRLGARADLPFGIEGANLPISLRPEPPMAWPRVAVHGQRLVIQSRRRGASFEVVDLSDPARIAIEASLAREPAEYYGPLAVAGDQVVSERRIATPAAAGELSYPVDRLELPEGGAPRLAVAVNLPGAVLSASADGELWLSIGYERAVVGGVTECCPGAGGCPSSSMLGDCEMSREVITLSRLEGDSASIVDRLEPDPPLGPVSRLAHASGALALSGGVEPWPPPESLELVSLRRSGEGIQLSRRALASAPRYGPGPFVRSDAHLAFALGDERVALATLALDGTVGEPEVFDVAPALDLALGPDALFVAARELGVVRIDLDP